MLLSPGPEQGRIDLLGRPASVLQTEQELQKLLARQRCRETTVLGRWQTKGEGATAEGKKKETLSYALIKNREIQVYLAPLKWKSDVFTFALSKRTSLHGQCKLAGCLQIVHDRSEKLMLVF